MANDDVGTKYSRPCAGGPVPAGLVRWARQAKVLRIRPDQKIEKLHQQQHEQHQPPGATAFSEVKCFSSECPSVVIISPPFTSE